MRCHLRLRLCHLGRKLRPTLGLEHPKHRSPQRCFLQQNKPPIPHQVAVRDPIGVLQVHRFPPWFVLQARLLMCEN